MKSIFFTATFILTAYVPLASADMFTPSHSCSKPFKPYQFNSEWEYQSFMDEVENYKRCIGDFVEEQNDQIEGHQEAAQDAIEDWNNFVNFELN